MTDGDLVRQWINVERTVLVRQYEGGTALEVVFRPNAGDTWGPPVVVVLEADQIAAP